ncbi:MAG: AMP-binding protein [Anaerovoracaceae bacterium]
MNNNKYKDQSYGFRYINDLKHMVDSSEEIFGNEPAYMVKDVSGGEYRKISYSQFKKDVDALGTKFLDLGLKGEKIAIIGENSYKWIVSYLATTNGTGVVVPLDKELPIEEITNLIERAQISAIVYSSKLEELVNATLENVDGVKYKIAMDEDEIRDGQLSLDRLIQEGGRLITQGNRDFIDAKINRDVMCTLLFTSGTTGLAKGVMLSHKNITANIYNMSKYVKIRGNKVGLSVLPMHHAYELTCHIFTGIYQGICVAICEGLKYIQKNMKESQATVMLGVPLVFETMHKKIWKQVEQSGKKKAFSKLMLMSRKLKLYNKQNLIRKMFNQIHQSTGNHLTLFIAGGAPINPQVIEDYQDMGIPMIQGYGMTENAPIIAVNRDYYSKSASVGQPLPGTQVKIINRNADGIGEIICKGPSVMIGYYNEPEDTEKVIKEGWLYTGDYGHLDEDGFLYVTGRKKNVIISKNGKNIYPEEIEHHLEQSDYIAEVIVFAKSDETKVDGAVSAEIYPNYEFIEEKLGDIDKEELHRILKETIEGVNEKMPPYKRVKRLVIRDTEFEKTTTRKIKR